MVSRQQRMDDFDLGEPPAGEPIELLCEDHNGTYMLPELASSCKDLALNYTNRMPETKSGQKSLYDLAKALGRWDNEGGASALSPEPDLGPDLALHAVEERVLRFLGAAVIMQWNDLPTEIQRKLFDDAASMSDSARQFELKRQIARFLHEHKDDE
jgi:hypothetical protein